MDIVLRKVGAENIHVIGMDDEKVYEKIEL
jgi:hypothetical protein